MAAPWIGIVNQAIPEYLRDVLDTTVYKRLWMAMIQNRGRLTTGVNGSYESRFPLDWREAPVTTLAYGQDIAFAPQDYLKWGSLEWKALVAADLMHVIEYMKIANSPNTVVDRYKQIVPKLISAIKNQIGLQIYNNANASGKTEDFDGLETACGTVEAAGSITDATCDVLDIVAAHSTTATYLGLPTYLSQSGTWSTTMAHSRGVQPNYVINSDWPEGSGDSEYGYRAPKLLNWSSSAWGTSAVTWESNCQRAISRAAMWIRNTAGGEGNGSSLMAMLSTNLMSGFKNSLRASTLILSPHKEAEQLGFGDVLNFEGVGVYSEYGCPINTGYILDMDDLELKFISKDIVESRGPFETPEGSYKWSAISLGNFKFDPRRLAKLFNYAAA